MNNQQDFEKLIKLWNGKTITPAHGVMSPKSHKCRISVDTRPIKTFQMDKRVKLEDIEDLDYAAIQLQYLFHLVPSPTAKKLRQILLKSRDILVGNPNASIGSTGRTILEKVTKNNQSRWKCEIEVLSDKITSITCTFIQVERQNNPVSVHAILLVDIIPNT